MYLAYTLILFSSILFNLAHVPICSQGEGRVYDLHCCQPPGGNTEALASLLGSSHVVHLFFNTLSTGTYRGRWVYQSCLASSCGLMMKTAASSVERNGYCAIKKINKLKEPKKLQSWWKRSVLLQRYLIQCQYQMLINAAFYSCLKCQCCHVTGSTAISFLVEFGDKMYKSWKLV